MLRVTLAQIKNHFRYDENLRSISRAIQHTAKHGSDLVLFPECATTGYNTGMLKIDADQVRNSIAAVQEAAREAKVTVALPTPWPAEDGKFTNSVLIIRDTGEITETFHKIGFQRGEQRLFIPGQPHSRFFDLKGYRIGVIICIETTHEPWAFLKQEDGADLILWPGFYACQPGSTWADAINGDTMKVKSNMDQWNKPLIQATCATSPEAHIWADQQFGGSAVFDHRGREVFTARLETEDYLVATFQDKALKSVRSVLFESNRKSAT